MQTLRHFCTDDRVAAGIEEECERTFSVQSDVYEDASIHQSERDRSRSAVRIEGDNGLAGFGGTRRAFEKVWRLRRRS